MAPNLYVFNFLLALPFFVAGNRRLPRALSNPKAGINDFIFDRMLRNRWSVWQQACVDKEFAKSIARAADPSVSIIPTLAVIKAAGLSAEDVAARLAVFAGRPVVAKPTHTSGGVVFLRSGLSLEDVARLTRHAKQNFFFARREAQYRNLEAKIIVEADISEGEAPIDYKFFCSDGRAHYCQVDATRFSDHRRALCSLPDFTVLPLTYGYERPAVVAKPKSLDRMIATAQKLSKGFDFVRIDLYERGDEIIFGEFTFSPCSGCDHISDDAFATRFLQAVRSNPAEP